MSMRVIVMMVIMSVMVVSMVVIVTVSRTLLTSKMVVTISRVEDLHLDQVENEAHHSDNEHQVSVDSWGHKESLSCLDEEPDCHNPDSGD